MSFTVVPLLGLDLGEGARVPFGKYFVLQEVPRWLEEHSDILSRLSEPERKSTLSARHALVSEYFADSWGFPDPDWGGVNPKGIQFLRFEAAMLANMAIWLIQPSPVHFTIGFHARTHLENLELEHPIIDPQHEPRLWPHPRDNDRTVCGEQIVRAANLYTVLSTVQRKNAIWPALRAIWGALVSYPPDQRYPMFWQALESLFGSETDTRRVGRRLRDRISYFLAENTKDQRDLHDKVEALPHALGYRPWPMGTECPI